MKKPRKILRNIVVVILIVILAVVAAAHLLAGFALKTGIEVGATRALNVGVSVGKASLSILGGKVSIGNLSVNNPPGYEHKKLLELKEASVKVEVMSLLGDVVKIRDIRLDGATVVLEQRGISGNNLQDVIKALPKSEKEAEERTKAGGKKLHVDNLEITNVTVKAKLLPVPGKADTVTFTLNPIKMTELGSDNKLDTARLVSKILLAISSGVAEKGVDYLPDEITDTMKATLSKTLDVGKTAAEEGKKLIKEGKGIGTDIIEGFKGLLKPKEDSKDKNQ